MYGTLICYPEEKSPPRGMSSVVRRVCASQCRVPKSTIAILVTVNSVRIDAVPNAVLIDHFVSYYIKESRFTE